MKTFVPNFEKRENGLLPVVVQDADSGQVLMLAYANCEAYVRTLKTREATYWSTSRNTLWIKGETSGNTQEIVDVCIDCDGDALVYVVCQTGEGACHTKACSCFFRSCIDARQLMDAPELSEKDRLPVADAESLLHAAESAPDVCEEPLEFLLPSGSLSKRVIELLAKVGYRLREPDRRGYCGTANGVAFHVRDRRMIPHLLGTRFDAGITGKDLVLAADREKDLRVVADLCFSRASDVPVRWVLASPSGAVFEEHARIGCELPVLARKILPSTFESSIVEIEGSEEMAIADGLCDAVLVLTETGSSLKANGLTIVEGCGELFISVPQILANPLNAAKSKSLETLSAALRSAVESAHRVMVTCDVLQSSLQKLDLPSAVSPTVMPLRDPQWAAVQICVQREELGSVLVQLEASGARSIIVQGIDGYLS